MADVAVSCYKVMIGLEPPIHPARVRIFAQPWRWFASHARGAQLCTACLRGLPECYVTIRLLGPHTVESLSKGAYEYFDNQNMFRRNYDTNARSIELLNLVWTNQET